MIHDKIDEKHNFINKLINQTLNLLQFMTNLVLCMCGLFYSSFVCISAYANVYFKTKIINQNIKIILIAGVPSSQALPGFLSTAPPSVCVPAALVALTVWIQNQKKKLHRRDLTGTPILSHTTPLHATTLHYALTSSTRHVSKLCKIVFYEPDLLECRIFRLLRSKF